MTTPLERWLQRVIAATVVAVAVALIGLALSFYGPLRPSRGLRNDDRRAAVEAMTR